ncbi:MAG: hypothetical protein GTN93_21365 [Anaerolineae bacterium]|nr:hypothetical protein [Anaerolineae bacterium]
MPKPAQHNLGPTDADFDDDIEDRPVRYSPGDIGQLLRPGLTELIEHRTTGEKQRHLKKFAEWLPPENMEDFLILCLEYGADKIMPRNKPENGKRSRMRVGAQRGRSAV